ncbi:MULTISPECIES: hypothetical protein [unclassified Nocardiopsis]|uniref:hypothetical protein n=1 Tax=unclassified Nocardiopsis TaxID=2649073 RepID=UPI0033C76734
MEKEEEIRLLSRIGQILLHSAPPGSREVECTAAMVGDMGEMWTRAVVADGSEAHVSTPIDLSSAFRELRSGMWAPGRGTWFSARYLLTPPSSFSVTYNFDREVEFSRPRPDSVDYYEDLLEHPRSPENTPVWLRERIEAAARAIATPRE